MSEIIAVAYDDLQTARQARDKMIEMAKEHVIALDDVVVVERRDDGKIKLHQLESPTARGAAGGALWGGLIGLIFFMPLLGMALGGASGAAFGAGTDTGVDDDFMRDLAQHLTPGDAAVFALVSKRNPDKAVPELAPLGGRILQTSLPTEDEERLREAVRLAQAGQPA